MVAETSLIRGWCPDLFTPMQARDGYLVRIRPPILGLNAEQARAVAMIAAIHGNSVIELTNRGNLQLRGFSIESARQAVRTAIDHGLADADPARERRRAVLVSPLSELDPDCHPETGSIAEKLQAALLADDALSKLPGKFGWGVDGGGLIPVGAISADVVLQAGAAGWSVVCGTVMTEPMQRHEAFQAALAVSRDLAGQADIKRPAKDADMTRKVLEKAGYISRPFQRSIFMTQPLVGNLPGNTIGVGLPFGRLHASQLDLLAGQLGTDRLRVTPWRSFILPQNSTDYPGFITNPHDPCLRVAACIGASGCERATEDVAQTALALASDVPAGCVLHVSGCVKGCAHPAAADMTLIAKDGHYDVVHNGSTKETATWCDRSLPDIRTLLHCELKETQA